MIKTFYNLAEHIGREFATLNVVAQEHVEHYQLMSVDLNPIHYDEKFAESTKFGKPIAPGIMIQSYAVRTIYYSSILLCYECYPVITKIEMKFCKPVFVGDIVRSEVKLKNVIPTASLLELELICSVEEEKKAEGSALVKLLKREN